MTQIAWISLGSNLGDREAHLGQAIAAISRLPGVTILEVSSLYVTDPWGDLDQPDFLNAVAKLDIHSGASELLSALQEIELDIGRRRSSRRWGPRLIDLDVLLVGEEIHDTPWLRLPHPRTHERAFVLVPLNELNPALNLPGHGTVAECLEGLDTDGVRRLAQPLWPVDKKS